LGLDDELLGNQSCARLHARGSDHAKGSFRLTSVERPTSFAHLTSFICETILIGRHRLGGRAWQCSNVAKSRHVLRLSDGRWMLWRLGWREDQDHAVLVVHR
jgi:hypothetical protein